MKRVFLNIKRRPIFLILTALCTGLACFAVQFNSFTREFGSFSKIIKTDYVSLLSEIAAWLMNKATDLTLAIVSVIILLLMVFAVSVVFALISSGFSYVLFINAYSDIHDSKRKPKPAGTLLKEGINKRFWSMTGYIFSLIVSAAVLLFVAMYGLMPVMMSISKVLGGDTTQIFTMIIFVVLAVVLLFFLFATYGMYMTFACPSVIAFKKGSFLVAVKMVNNYYWYLLPRTVGFIVYNLAITAGMLALGYGSASSTLGIVVFVINWFLRTMGMLVYIDYTFYTYIDMKEDMFDEVKA